AAVRVQHQLRVAVVGGDQADPAAGVRGLDDPPEAAVDRLDGSDGCGDHTGVPDHVRVGEVDEPEADARIGDPGAEALGHPLCAHRRRLVVRGDVAARV